MDGLEYFAKTDDIIACATGGFSHTAIGVIRISGSIGPKKLTKALNLPGSIEPRKCYLFEIKDKNRFYDQVLLTYFEAPKSYTGENVFEFSCHGNPLIIRSLIDFFAEQLSLRKAEAGEFTYRALRNKKLNLSQVEGLDVLLNSKSSIVVDSGLKMLRGDLEQDFLKLKGLFLKLKSALELNIDFSDDIGEEKAWELLKDSFDEFSEFIKSLNKRGSIEPEVFLRPKIALFGATNAGKSTLFNKILNKSRSIVSDTPGTTRDYISETLFLDGHEFELIDTAGLRKTSDKIEEIGIDFSKEIFEKSFFKVLVIDASLKESFASEGFGDIKGKCDLIVFTHIDKIENYFCPDGSIGANLLKDDIADKVLAAALKKLKKLLPLNPIIVPRHRCLVNKIYDLSNEYASLMESVQDIAVLGSELNLLEGAISELLGQVKTEDVLQNIFCNFCIGK